MCSCSSDGLSYVRDSTGRPCHDPGGRASIVAVPERLVDQSIAAALDCPGECIFLEDDEPRFIDDLGIVEAEIIESGPES